MRYINLRFTYLLYLLDGSRKCDAAEALLGNPMMKEPYLFYGPYSLRVAGSGELIVQPILRWELYDTSSGAIVIQIDTSSHGRRGAVAVGVYHIYLRRRNHQCRNTRWRKFIHFAHPF